MPASKRKAANLPEEFKSIGDAAAFWDAHDASDYWGQTREVRFDATLSKEPKVVVLEAGIAKRVSSAARKRHVSAETLVNLWLKEKLASVR